MTWSSAAFVVPSRDAHRVFELGDHLGERGAEVGEAGGVGEVPHLVDALGQVLHAGLAHSAGGRGEQAPEDRVAGQGEPYVVEVVDRRDSVGRVGLGQRFGSEVVDGHAEGGRQVPQDPDPLDRLDVALDLGHPAL